MKTVTVPPELDLETAALVAGASISRGAHLQPGEADGRWVVDRNTGWAALEVGDRFFWGYLGNPTVEVSPGAGMGRIDRTRVILSVREGRRWDDQTVTRVVWPASPDLDLLLDAQHRLAFEAGRALYPTRNPEELTAEQRAAFVAAAQARG